MSEEVEFWQDMKQVRKQLRERFGVPCPVCVEKLPKAHPSILLPQQRCKIHGYIDPRSEEIMGSSITISGDR